MATAGIKPLHLDRRQPAPVGCQRPHRRPRPGGHRPVAHANGFAVTFDKPFDPTTLSLYSAPADVLLVNSAGRAVRGSLVLNTASDSPPDTSFTFVATGSGVLAAGTYTVTLVSGPGGIKDASGVELDGTDSGIPGNNYVTTFTVASTPSVILSIPDFARGPDSAANILLPNATGSGIPITLTRRRQRDRRYFHPDLQSRPAHHQRRTERSRRHLHVAIQLRRRGQLRLPKRQRR